MWWEAIPSYAVIAVCMGLYPMVTYVVNKLEFGIAYRRQMMYIGDAQLYLRDERISGCDNAYVQKGLENIPDAAERPKRSAAGAAGAADCKCD